MKDILLKVYILSSGKSENFITDVLFLTFARTKHNFGNICFLLGRYKYQEKYSTAYL